MRRGIWSDESRSDVKGLDKSLARRVVDAVVRYNETGYGDVKKLKGKVALYRLRVGDYRIIFAIDDSRDELVVLRVAYRREVYR